jgi:predicted DNA-binding protein
MQNPSTELVAVSTRLPLETAQRLAAVSAEQGRSIANFLRYLVTREVTLNASRIETRG